MHYVATKLEFLDDVCVQLTFQDGKVIKFDMASMFNKYPQLKELRNNRKLFESGHLDPGGYCIIWNDDLDFDVSSIYEDGILVRQEEISLNKQIGILLAKTRNELNITQTELARMSHIDQGDISKIEKGLGNPTIKKINTLFTKLGKKPILTIE